MAGMLPGVESARRRRFHQTGPSSDCPHFTRRPSLCLYSSNHEFLHFSSSLQQRNVLYQARTDEKLAGAAGEAKERLDERLRSAQKKSLNKRKNIKEKEKCREGRPELHIEVYGSKKSGGSRMMFNWRKLSWKASDQEDCAVCLESFKIGETLTHLPCAHRFHCSCLEPWLQNNNYCPCCRTSIVISH
ncbi:probable E3 ubiquitin-protein ligase RHY1A [Prosopis cineraria]|uniref:probable E3 ubiquitin-protein ligase RHY1A n=1 Tax=Prosopis cineraria TaxID=364024 RepID=UPI00240F81F4|nr:probable E3 ubiquitin-protein ligase RHY1A [Prosopis cineraria]XP_054807248.1 probable E3 ubiquitin-protein ligase RHY1A [Prosopis cineraria]XP_054807350.1 probable E3 ubiquitin-protein ligase RHY1A [Prosopis cineraria]